MPKSRAKRKLRKRVERPDGRGDGDSELGPPVRPYVSVSLSLSPVCVCVCVCLSICLPANRLDWAGGDWTGRGVRERERRDCSEGKKPECTNVSRRDRAVRCDAIRTMQCNAI